MQLVHGTTVAESDFSQHDLSRPHIAEIVAATNEAESLQLSQTPVFVNNVPQQFYNAFVLFGVVFDVNLEEFAGTISVNTETDSVSDTIDAEKDVDITSTGGISSVAATQNSTWSTNPFYIVLNKSTHNGTVDIASNDTRPDQGTTEGISTEPSSESTLHIPCLDTAVELFTIPASTSKDTNTTTLGVLSVDRSKLQVAQIQDVSA
ncbi:hypothetical protein FEM48_Zijuj03G0062800 [Ziziphus jujuba var. spinosa]|uniref:Uncharacterized protein n=1 Tax=Ziziphus jujuba var. spinosa TaxID=714518 RepID=A0A978VNN8_ZIZJJ|nr:hypothetical protein FEM48_Zijuj03G0062800 [Ziziphus jujuba var. spinosa]